MTIFLLDTSTKMKCVLPIYSFSLSKNMLFFIEKHFYLPVTTNIHLYVTSLGKFSWDIQTGPSIPVILVLDVCSTIFLNFNHLLTSQAYERGTCIIYIYDHVSIRCFTQTGLKWSSCYMN